MLPYEVRILPCIRRHIIPGEEPVVTGSNAVEMNPAGSIRTRGAVQIKSLAARRIGDENHGRIDERLLLAVENSSIERTGIRADGNFELAARGIDTERRIQRIDGDIGPI